MSDDNKDNQEESASVKHLTDNQLAVLSAEGRKDCFAELVRRYTPRLLGYVLNQLSSREDAEDAVQQTFLKAYLKIHTFKAEKNFCAWIFAAAYHETINMLRKRKIKSAEISEYSDKLQLNQLPEDELAASEERRNIWRLAKLLPKEQYAVLYLRYSEDMPIEQIAAVMGKTNIYVRVLLHRGRRRLGRIIRQYSNNNAEVKCFNISSKAGLVS